MQQDLLACYQAQFGESVKYYAIDQGNWPPMALSQHYHNGIWYFLTLGMSIRPMPQVDFLFDELAPQYRRAELAMAVDGEVMTESNAVQMASALAEFVHLPWARLTWLGEGHTLASEVAPVGFESYLLANELAPEQAQFPLPRQDGDRPTLLWATPVTEAERQFAQSEAQGGQQLRERLTAGGNTHIFRPREQVVNTE